jgi:hypothetical protein
VKGLEEAFSASRWWNGIEIINGSLKIERSWPCDGSVGGGVEGVANMVKEMRCEVFEASVFVAIYSLWQL